MDSQVVAVVVVELTDYSLDKSYGTAVACTDSWKDAFRIDNLAFDMVVHMDFRSTGFAAGTVSTGWQKAAEIAAFEAANLAKLEVSSFAFEIEP
jgi:hypothetical protein